MAVISVIMGIYNCASTLAESIESIINQTFTDWQLIMCDDGSTDDTYLIAKSYVDGYPNKMVLICNQENKGLNITLNNCLAVASGEYIARMDGDDISLPERFEKEIAFLRQNPEYSIVSTNMFLFDENGVWGQTHSKPIPRPADMAEGTPHCHAACLVKKEAFDLVNGYSTEKRFMRVEDRNLWFKMYTAGYRGANLEEPLYMMRDNRDAVTRRTLKYRVNGARVGLDVVRAYHLGFGYWLKALKPIAIGLLPLPVYRTLHKLKHRG